MHPTDSCKMRSEGSGSDDEMKKHASYLEESIPSESNTSEVQDKVKPGEPSASPPPEPKEKKKPLEEVIEESVPELNRGIDNMPDGKSFMHVCSEVSVDLNLIQSQWPVLSALKNTEDELKEIKQKMKESKGTHMEMEATKEMKNRMRDMPKKLKKLDEQQREDTKKVDDLVKDFTTEGVSAETLREKNFRVSFMEMLPLLIKIKEVR